MNAYAPETRSSLEARLKDEVIYMYREIAENPSGEYHFFHGRKAAEMFGYSPDWLDRSPPGAVSSFAGVGNPHDRLSLQPGETILDLGCGAGLDSIIAAWYAGKAGRVVGVDMNPAMCNKAREHGEAAGVNIEVLEARIEDIPLPDGDVNTVISNGVINLSLNKRKVIEEIYRVLTPGGKVSITDIVSAKKLSQSIVDDPKKWAS